MYKVKLLETHTAQADQHKNGYLAFGDTIMVYPRGEAIKKARIFGGKIELASKEIVRETYKVWMVIEKHTIYADGAETHEDIEEPTLCAGTLESEGAAIRQMEMIEENYNF